MADHQTNVAPLSLDELRDLTILFAEDNASIRTHISRLLTPLCRTLYTAENGSLALELFWEKMPDIVLTDISMPVMSGLELARQIKIEYPLVPIIIISSNTETEHLLQAIDLHLEGYLIKPVNVQKLLHDLQQQALLLRARRQSMQQNRLLSGVNLAIQYLLSADANQDAVDLALQEMAKAAQAGKIFLYQYQELPDHQLEPVLVSGFAGEDTVLRFIHGNEPDPYKLPFLERWHGLLQQGKTISGGRSSFPAAEQPVIDAMQVCSLLMTPIFEQGNLWGFSCLCDSTRERAWSETEISMVMTAARGLGSFVGRLKLENERREARRSLELANMQWQKTFDTIPDMVTVLDMSHQMVHINKAARERMLIGETGADSFVGPCFQHVHGLSHPPEGCPHSKLLQDGQPHETEVFVPKLNCYLHITVNPTFDYEGRLAGSVHVARDITRRREMEDQLRYVSTHDELTKLHNRAFFEAEIAQLAKQRTDEPVSIVIADLDGLKETNDRFGHEYGDSLIQTAADLLRETFRSGDTIARIGGDEFAVILKGVDEALLASIMERACQIMDEEQHLSEHGLKVQFSVGAATTSSPEQLQETIKAADMAMYQAKKSRKAKQAELSTPS